MASETTRRVTRVMCCLVRCEICHLFADGDETNSAISIEIQYGGPSRDADGNKVHDLAAIWRRPYVCRPCIIALADGLKL